MAWTYNVAQLASSILFQIRYLIGDTISTDPQLQDEEIQFAYTLEASNIWSAAANCCRALASRLSRQADTMVGEQRVMYSSRASAYTRKAYEYDTKATLMGSGIAFAGGMTFSQKDQQQQNPDRVPPNFQIGMTDNWLPVGPAGNESEDAPGN
jgi:hypothetical protein